MGIFDKLKKKKDGEKVSETEGEAVASENKAPKARTSVQSRSNTVLVKTLVSEKATIAEGKGVYTFVVDDKTNKLEVKKAVKEIYGVAPKKVRMINVEGKEVRLGNKQGRRSGWKKAIVTLPKGKIINIHEGV